MQLNVFSVSVLIVFILISSCHSNSPVDNPSEYILNQHRQFSKYTSPGEYAYLYQDLPESLEDLCDLIKKQLIHPFDAHKFGDSIPEERKFEDRDYPAVPDMLEELIERNENGLISTRKPEERLVVACVHHSMLLASILRHRGIPVRIRAGYANYIIPEKNIKVSHVVCEVWDAEKNRWILVDPDRNKVNFDRDEFEFAYESWDLLRKKEIRKSGYFARSNSVDAAILHLLCHDLYYIIGSEEIYWEDPPLVFQVENDLTDLSTEDLTTLDKLAEYLENPDKHYTMLAKLYTDNTNLHIEKRQP